MADENQRPTNMAETKSAMGFHDGEEEHGKQPISQEGFPEEVALDLSLKSRGEFGHHLDHVLRTINMVDG